MYINLLHLICEQMELRIEESRKVKCNVKVYSIERPYVLINDENEVLSIYDRIQATDNIMNNIKISMP